MNTNQDSNDLDQSKNAKAKRPKDAVVLVALVFLFLFGFVFMMLVFEKLTGMTLGAFSDQDSLVKQLFLRLVPLVVVSYAVYCLLKLFFAQLLIKNLYISIISFCIIFFVELLLYNIPNRIGLVFGSLPYIISTMFWFLVDIVLQIKSAGKILGNFITQEIKNTWWHRLVLVFAVMTTSACFVFVLILYINNGAWKPQYHQIYSFQNDFQEVSGDIYTCSAKKGNLPGLLAYQSERFFVSCGAKPDFFSDISKEIYFEYFNAKNERPRLSITSEDAAQFLVDNGIVNNLSQKRFVTYDDARIFEQTISLVLVPILWFLLYYHVIYRLFIYIIFGTNKEN